MTITDPMTTVQQYIDNFNRGDEQEMAAAFALPGSILDIMAAAAAPPLPQMWHGPAAALDWYRDLLIESKRAGASGHALTLSEPLHINITDNKAYVVVPASMTFMLRGNQVTQSVATFTISLRRIPGGWLIADWKWAKSDTGGICCLARACSAASQQ